MSMSHAVTSKDSSSELSSEFSGKRALGAGAIVILITVVSYLGLLIRDLLLINRSGFGASLDSFYLAMMVPMFFVSVLALPMGDALTTGYSSNERPGRYSVPAWSPVGMDADYFRPAWLDSVFGAEPIFQIFVASGEIDEAVMLLPIALLLFFFSGVVVTGNSLMNSLGRPATAAAAQLVVPLVAVGAILFANDDQLIKAATVGMGCCRLVDHTGDHDGYPRAVALGARGIARDCGYLVCAGGCGLGYSFQEPGCCARRDNSVLNGSSRPMDDLGHRSQVIQPLNCHAEHSF